MDEFRQLSATLARALGTTTGNNLANYMNFLLARNLDMFLMPHDLHDYRLSDAAKDPENIATFIALTKLGAE